MVTYLLEMPLGLAPAGSRRKPLLPQAWQDEKIYSPRPSSWIRGWVDQEALCAERYFRVLKLTGIGPKDQLGTHNHLADPVDLISMHTSDSLMDWNLVLISSSPDGPERVLRFLEGAVGACGGWVLSRGSSGEECAEIDFEFPRANCVEIYSVLVATGINLSMEAHGQLTELCHCTKYLLESKALDIVRMHLTIYTRAASAWKSDEEEKATREAA